MLLLAAGGSAGVAQVAILVLTALTLLLLIDSDFTRNAGEYVSVVLMAAAGGLIISAAQDLLVIFIGLELLTLGLYILTAFAKQSGKSAEAAIKYYLFGGMSAAFLLFGFSYLYGLSGSTSLHKVVLGTYHCAAQRRHAAALFALVMVAAGLGFKVAAVPFHLWAPDTYEGAPAPAAAFIASVSKVASFALLISISTALAALPSDPGTSMVVAVFALARQDPAAAFCIGLRSAWPLILMVLSVASMVFGNLAALAQSSVRRLLAYSAIAHAGYILLGPRVLLLDQRERAGHPLLHRHLRPHHHRRIRRGRRRGARHRLRQARRFPRPAQAQSAARRRAARALSLARRNSAAGRLLGQVQSLRCSARQLGGWARSRSRLVALAIAFSAVSLYYYLQVLKRAYVMPAADESPIEAHPVTLAVLVAIAAAVVVLGCFPALLQNWIASFYAGM